MKKFFIAIFILFFPPLAMAHEVLNVSPPANSGTPAMQDYAPVNNNSNASAASGDFNDWLVQLRKDALAAGVKASIFDSAFANSNAPLDRVIELDKKQPETTLTLDQYVTNVVTARRIADGKKHYAAHRALVDKIGKKYGVQPRFIVALWGVETNFGAHTGGFNTIDALATLAYDGRRADFFRSELLDALKILQQEHMESSELKGSWAGALGQCQFMPDSYLKYAVDYNHDGKRDIWNTPSDVFASIANYLKSSGWNDNVGWGRRVKLPDDFDNDLADINAEKTLLQWKKLGVRAENGSMLPAKNVKASLIWVGEGDDAVPYLIYSNYKVLLKWNRSRFFATSVGMLADKIAAR